MSSRRVQKVEKELRGLVSQFFLTGINDPLLGIVSVSRVVASPDLRTAKVYISFLNPDEGAKEESFYAISERKGELQRYIGQHLGMKFCPKLQILEDEGLQHQIRIEKILHGLKTEESDEE